MTIKFVRIIFILLIVLLSEHSRAEHLVGGEISYTCLGNNEYLVTLKIYRDCFSSGAEFDFNANMTIFEGGSLFQNTSWSGFESVDLPIVASGPCYVDPPNLCLEMGIYETVVFLPPSPQGYTIVHQRCCRGPAILNLNVPEAQGNTYFIDIPPNDVPCNNSAAFDELPPATICANEELVFDHSAVETDGDSLVYELCTPFNGGTELDPAPNPATPPPYDPVSWAAGFFAGDPIIADDPFIIDPETGLFEGTPTQIGQFVVGICVSEYRDGDLLSTTRRDFQINVITCTPALAAVPGLAPDDEGGCTGLDFQFTNESFNADIFHWDFGVPGDPTAVSDEFEPEFTYADTGTYNVTLVANPGEVCADTSYLEVAAYNPVDITIDSAGFVCEDGQLWGFEAGGDFNPNAAQFTWSFGAGSEPVESSEQNPDGVLYDSEGTKTITVEVDQSGCTDESTMTIVVESLVVAAIAPQSEFCQGLTMNFTNESENAESYEWHFDDPAAPDIVTGNNAVHTFSEPGEYNVMMVAKKENACPDTAFGDFQVYELLDPFFESPASACFDGHSFSFQADGAFHAGADFLWEFGEEASPQTSTATNPQQVTFEESGYFPVSLTVTQDVCEETHTGHVQLYDNPVAEFSSSNREGCAPHRVSFQNESITDTELICHWDFGDGATSQSTYPSHLYTEPGVYTVTLDIATTNGCIGESQRVRTDYITVLPTPQAGFSFDPMETDIFNPEVQVINESEDSDFCTYTFEDGTVLENCDLTYFFEEAGEHEVYQVVTNEEGCQDAITHTFEVLGHLFYAPNSFTPNEDGINDIFKPVVMGISAYELRIINRTGEVIFTSTDPDLGWDGSGIRNTHYSEPEVFVYQVRLADMRGLNYDYQGHVSVIR